MPEQKASLTQTNFTSGILSPKLHGRTELAQYANGLDTCVNYAVMAQGGIERRPGTKYIGEVKNSANITKLVPFIYSTEQAYILEFGNLYVRFYRDEGLLTVPPIVEVVTPYLSSDLAELTYTQSADVLYLFHPNYQPRKLTRTSLTSFTLSLFDFIDGPFLEVNTTAVTMTPSATTGAITIAASAAIFAATDVGRLIRIEHTSKWGCAKITGFTSSTLVNATVQANCPFNGVGAVTSWRFGAWSDTLGWPHVGSFHEGRLYVARNKTYPQDIWATVSGLFETFSPTRRVGTANDAITDDSGFSYRLSTDRVNAITYLVSARALQIGTTDGEFALTGSSIDQALTPTNAQAKRDTIQGSLKIPPIKIGASILFVHRTGSKVLDYKYLFESDQFDTEDISLLADNLFRPDTVTGTAFSQFPYNLAWFQMSSGALLGLTYIASQKVLAWQKHIIGGSGIVKSIAVIPSTNKNFDQLWLIVQRTINGVTKQYVETLQDWYYPTNSEDKDFCFYLDSGLTYNVPLTITGITQANPAVVTSNAHGLNNGDEVKLYSIQGMTELNDYKFTVANVTANTFELSGINSTGYAAYTSGGIARKLITTISGLSHLEGESVSILADGANHANKTVAGGSITLDRKAAIVTIGYSCPSYGKGLPIDVSGNGTSTINRTKRINKLGIRLLNSVGLEIGAGFDRMDEIPFRASSDKMNNSPPLFTGLKFTNFPSGHGQLVQVAFRQSSPFPSCILSLHMDVSLQEVDQE